MDYIGVIDYLLLMTSYPYSIVTERTVLLSTHHLDEAEIIGDRILIIHKVKYYLQFTSYKFLILSLQHTCRTSQLLLYQVESRR